jgi:16S rRNA G966 N2-methylase RsmD
VTFVERDRSARDRLRRNLEAIGQAEDAAVLAVDVFAAGLARLLAAGPYTLLFVDPPYRLMTDGRSARQVYAQIGRLAAAAADEALLVLRTEKHIEPQPAAGWSGPTSRTHGSMTLHFYERP